MSANLHAGGLIAVVLSTVVFCVLGSRRIPTLKRVLGSLVASGFVTALFLPGAIHMCDRGQPSAQLLLFLICLLAILVAVSNRRAAVIGAAALCVAMGLLCQQYVTLVHGNELTGNPVEGSRRLERIANQARQLLLQKTAGVTAPLPAGWLSESSLAGADVKQLLTEACPRPACQRVEATPLWHTPLTRLWSRKAITVDLWTPGGSVAEAASYLEWRPRP